MFNRIRDLLQTEKPTRGRSHQPTPLHSPNHAKPVSANNVQPQQTASLGHDTTVVVIRDISPSRTVRSDESDYEGGSARRNLTPTRCPISYTKIKELGKSMNIRTNHLIDISAAATIHNVQKYVENVHRHPEITYVILKYNTKQTAALLRILIEPSALKNACGCFVTSKGNFPINKQDLELNEIRIEEDRRSF